jgi:hypothetical protein
MGRFFMQEKYANESPRRRILRRVGAAGMALAAVLTLGACRATGGWYIDEPLPGPSLGEYTGDANFGFNFTCEMETTKKKAVIKGEITYHDDPSKIFGLPNPLIPEVRLHGTVKPLIINGVDSCKLAIEGMSSALFTGTYRSQDPTLYTSPPGTFRVQVFDQGEPGGSPEDFTGDEFSIQLLAGPYNGYTRGGYIEGGNVQVED